METDSEVLDVCDRALAWGRRSLGLHGSYIKRLCVVVGRKVPDQVIEQENVFYEDNTGYLLRLVVDAKFKVMQQVVPSSWMAL